MSSYLKGAAKMRKVLGVAALAFFFSVAARPVAAAPVWASGNECPTDAQMGSFSRQYSITQATACVYDSTSNIQGDDGEATAYLTGGPQPLWGTGWVGLGQNPTGYSFTADAGNDDGTFTINPAQLGNYNHTRWASRMAPTRSGRSSCCRWARSPVTGIS